MRPERWPAGDPEAHIAVGNYGDVDGSKVKEFILSNVASPEIKPFYEISFSKRPAEELFDLRSDPEQKTNVAMKSEYAATRVELRGRVETWMRETADPRVDPSYDAWDKYPYFGGDFRKRAAKK